MESMTAAEATVSSLIAHGIGTMYALPGIHNDWLFDALFNASDRIRVVHTRHEQGAAYMALGAALATNEPQPYAVVPGPGLLNTGAALLTAYAMNAPVLALIGQIPDADIGKGIGHLHEIRDQAGIIARLVDFSARIRSPEVASRHVAEAIRSMFSGRPGPAALECAIDMWGRRGTAIAAKAVPDTSHQGRRGRRAHAAARKLGAAKRVLIICGGGAQDSSAEITQLSEMLQAPVLAYRRGRGVLDGQQPVRSHTAARTRTLGRSRCGPRRRHPYVHPAHAMGHRRQSGCDPRRCRCRRSRPACINPPSRSTATPSRSSRRWSTSSAATTASARHGSMK